MTAQSVSQKPIRTILVSLTIGFLLALIIGYNLFFMEGSIQSVLAIFSHTFQRLFIEALPFLLFGALTSGLIEVFIRHEDIDRYIPKNSLLAVFSGLFLGIVFPVAEIGVIPVLRRLFKKGLPLSAGITFLLSAPFINPIIIASSSIALGFGTIFLARFTITIIIALIIGLIFALNATSDDILLVDSTLNSSNPARPTIKAGLSESVMIATHEFFELGRLLVIGCLLASMLQTLINPSDLQLIAERSVVSVLLMQGYAFVLSINSSVDSFAVLPFINSFPTGTILAFLVSGSMLDLKSTLLLLAVFKKRAIIYLIVLMILMNLLAGVIINLLPSLF